MLALVGLFAFASTLSVGRTPTLSAAIMVVVVADVWVVSQVLERRGRRAHLASRRGIVQFTTTLVVTAIVFSPSLPTPVIFALFPISGLGCIAVQAALHRRSTVHELQHDHHPVPLRHTQRTGGSR